MSTAVFGANMILRASAERRPKTAQAKDQFDRLDAGQRSGAFLVATSMFRVPMEWLEFGPNLKLVAAFGLAVITYLAVIDAFAFAT